ncbi:cell envelope integrity protein TolA [Gellertiella hungarica]|uniref:cell envelope integrity protein TolA n=1 Tax=Gellertiella hungarica TaxID=1572859 RepID=UPI00160FCD84|nr:cell envelope integrity protein TolA [Gellertiella hungarica]
MKRSLVASAVLHALLLGWALVKLGAPEDFDMANSESLPVEFVPITDITQIQQGDKEAPVKEKAAPVPTKRPDTVQNAENVGDNDVDLKSAPKPIEKPSKTEAAAAPKQTEKPVPTPDEKSNDVKEVAKEETDVADPTPKPEPKPEEAKPVEKPAEKPPEEAKPEEPKPEEQAMPENVPVPAPKPKVEKPKQPEKKPEETKTAEAKAESKASDKKKAETKQDKAKSQATQKSDFNADEIADLLNKTDSQGGGAKRSSGEKAFGGKKTTGGEKLSQSELDGLRGQITDKWTYTAGLEGAEEVVIEVRFSLDESGNVVGDIEATATGGPPSTQQALLSAAKRAIRKATPFQGLPPEKYDTWKDVIASFTVADLGG